MDMAETRERILNGTAPRDLSVTGELDLRGCASLTALPEDLAVDGNLDPCVCRSLGRLPRNLSVRGQLYP